MKRKNVYLSELGIPRAIYAGNFVTEKKRYRMYQRYQYGFDYRDIYNLDTSFARSGTCRYRDGLWRIFRTGNPNGARDKEGSGICTITSQTYDHCRTT